jgi:hypothetical protein
MDYTKIISRVEFRTDQKPLIARGLVIHTDFEGNQFKVGDQVNLYDIETDKKIVDGIIVLILDQGICIISQEYWMQVHSHYYRECRWEHVTKVNLDFNPRFKFVD